MAPALGVDVKPIDAGDGDEIKRKLAEFSRDGKGGLIVTSSRLARIHREQIIMLAAHHRLPAIYAFRVYVTGGGLMSYGPDATTPYRRAASYIDRIFKGEKPADLPVQAPTKYELTINLKTGKGHRSHRARDTARPRRRGDRVKRREFITLLGGRRRRGR